jgi:hypothetical protein
MLDAADAMGGEGRGADASADWPPLPLECGGLRRAAVNGATDSSSLAATDDRSEGGDDSQTGEWAATAACDGCGPGCVSLRSLASVAVVSPSAAIRSASLHTARRGDNNTGELRPDIETRIRRRWRSGSGTRSTAVPDARFEKKKEKRKKSLGKGNKNIEFDQRKEI